MSYNHDTLVMEGGPGISSVSYNHDTLGRGPGVGASVNDVDPGGAHRGENETIALLAAVSMATTEDNDALT